MNNDSLPIPAEKVKDLQYYPRNARAPYLFDTYDLGIGRIGLAGEGFDGGNEVDGTAIGMLLGGIDHDSGSTTSAAAAATMMGYSPAAGRIGGGSGSGFGKSGSLLNLTTSTAGGTSSSSAAAQQSSNNVRRRSSFARVLSTLGISSMAIAEEEGGEVGGENNLTMMMTGGGGGPDDSGGGMMLHYFQDSETTPNSLMPPKFRRGVSSESSVATMTSYRDRSGSNAGGGGGGSRIPRWALHDLSSIVMKDGMPIPLGALVHYHHRAFLLRQSLNTSLPTSSMMTPPQYMVTPSWRLKERMKTVGVCLVLALNIGTDPPDLNKPTPCAKLQCWLDPTSVSRAKAKERIGERLEQQYAKWQQRSKLKYRRALDPTVEVVKDLCLRMRESARTERVLFHYNGQGVPRPTANGEIWLFDKHHTNYIPLSVTDLRRWIGRPSIVVLDCSGAGVLMPFFTSALESSGSSTTALDPTMSSNSIPPGGGSSSRNGEESYLKAIRDTIVLCPTSQGEWLPLNPVFPADLFTSCLTTPIAVALRWFIRQTPLSTQGLDLETIADAIPGKLTDRKTPLGELNWIFTAITDTIAWNVLPSPLFQRLFRQDLLVASLFRNYLLADRILRSLNCTPMSHPELPSTCHHPLWQAWDLAVETCLTQLIDSGHLKRGGSIGSIGDVAVSSSAAAAEGGEGEDVADTAQQQCSESHTRQMSSSSSGGDRVDVDKSLHPDVNAPFFAEQLTAFELWLEWASTKSRNKLVIRCPPSAVGGTPLPFLQGREDAELASHELDPPQELPIVLQVLLSPAHRVRTLVLLRRLFELGPSAVNLALSVGIFPYVLKLLQSPIDEYKHVLVGIWARILKFDTSCQEDLVKDRALPHFIRHLSWGYPSPQSNSPTPTPTISLEDASEQRTMAAFILAVICSGYPLGQSEAINEKLHITCCTLLQSLESTDERERVEADTNLTPPFRMWLIICLGNLAKDNPTAQLELYKSGLHLRLLSRLDDDSPDVRTAACYALGYFIGTAPERPASSEAYPPLLSTFQQFQQPPQSLAPTFEQGSVPRTLPGSIVGTPTVPLDTISQPLAISSTSLMPTFNPSGTQGQLRPQLIPSLSGLSGQAHGGISLSHGQQPMMLSNILSATVPPARVSPQLEPKSVYDDTQRMDFDLSVAIKLAETTKDASPQVRFEAVLAVNRCMAKYIEAFVSIAGNKKFGQLQGRSILGGTVPSIAFPEGLGHDAQKTVTEIWASINRSDPFPTVREVLNSIVGSVNKRAMLEKTRLSQQRANRTSRRSSLGNDYGNDVLPPLLAGANPPSSASLDPGLKHSTFTIGTPPSVLVPDSVSPRKGFNQSFEAMVHEDYFCPESKFFLWKKVAFGKATDNSPLDPLSSDGAMNRYRKTRNNLVREKSQLLKETFAVLAERPRIYQSPYAYDESDAAAGIEKDAELKKEALQLEQMSLLQNTGERSTSFLRFHPFEPALVVCGSSDNVSVWNAESSERMMSFSNGNPKNTRITSALWINEESTSLLLTGTNAGTVRIYDGLFETNDEISREKPSLISSFVAAPDIVSDKRYSSGLVMQFQQCTGRLVAGGNTKVIRCWDLSAEKCYNSFDSKSEASLTALTNAWCYEHNGGYSGIGPDVIVAGYGNGSLRVFDTRSNTGEPVHTMNEGRHSLRSRMHSKFDEHTNWIVDVSFTTYGGRNEIVSGCVAGAFKFWDLRYSSSIRTIDHKMQMTALAAHSQIPMFATGSPAQFIKIMSHDGMTQQVIRYHEKISGQRLGPVSSLSFHPHMPYLAAGFADEIVSVYAPKGTITL